MVVHSCGESCAAGWGTATAGTNRGPANTPQCSWGHTNCKSCPEPGAEPTLLPLAVMYCCVRAVSVPKVGLQSHTKLETSESSSRGSDARTPQQLHRVFTPSLASSHFSKLAHFYSYIPLTPCIIQVLWKTHWMPALSAAATLAMQSTSLCPWSLAQSPGVWARNPECIWSSFSLETLPIN